MNVPNLIRAMNVFSDETRGTHRVGSALEVSSFSCKRCWVLDKRLICWWLIDEIG